MKVAAFQMSAAIDPDQRLNRIKAAAEEAARAGADLMVAPELALTGYGRGAVLQELAQPADGPWIQALQKISADTHISLVAGFPERDGASCFISAVIIDRDAPDDPGIYRKGHLYGDYEKGIFEPGEPSTVLVEMQGLKLGFLICYDIEFPENTRRLAMAGADAIIVPTALPKGASAEFIARHVVRVRAFENQVFVVYADHADADQSFEYQGLSSIAAPDGEALAFAPLNGDVVIYGDIDPSRYHQTRLENPYLADVGRVWG